MKLSRSQDGLIIQNVKDLAHMLFLILYNVLFTHD